MGHLSSPSIWEGESLLRIYTAFCAEAHIIYRSSSLCWPSQRTHGKPLKTWWRPRRSSTSPWASRTKLSPLFLAHWTMQQPRNMISRPGSHSSRSSRNLSRAPTASIISLAPSRFVMVLRKLLIWRRLMFMHWTLLCAPLSAPFAVFSRTTSKKMYVPPKLAPSLSLCVAPHDWLLTDFLSFFGYRVFESPKSCESTFLVTPSFSHTPRSYLRIALRRKSRANKPRELMRLLRRCKVWKSSATKDRRPRRIFKHPTSVD